MKVPIPSPQQCMVWSVFLILAFPMGVWWYLIVVLISIFLMTYDMEDFFHAAYFCELASKNRHGYCLFLYVFG